MDNIVDLKAKLAKQAARWGTHLPLLSTSEDMDIMMALKSGDFKTAEMLIFERKREWISRERVEGESDARDRSNDDGLSPARHDQGRCKGKDGLVRGRQRQSSPNRNTSPAKKPLALIYDTCEIHK